MASEIFVRWRKELLDKVEWLSKVLFQKASANVELYPLALAVAVEFECPVSEGTPSATGPRTGLQDPIYSSMNSAVVLSHLGIEQASKVSEGEFRQILEDYANGGIAKLFDVLEQSRDPLGTLVELLNSTIEEQTG